MRQAMNKWLKRHQITFSADTANSICSSLGLDGEKVDECLGLCYQLEVDKITQAEFTGGLCVLTGKEPEEVMGILKGVKAEVTGDTIFARQISTEPKGIQLVLKELRADFDAITAGQGRKYKDTDAVDDALKALGCTQRRCDELTWLVVDFTRKEQLAIPKAVTPEVMGVLKGITKSGSEEIKIQIKPFIGHKDTSTGGSVTLYKDDKEIGHAMVAFEHKDTTYPISGFVPAKTAVMDTMEIFEGEKGKGYGKKFIGEIERIAKEQGMETMHLISVMGESEEFWRKQGYQFSGHKRIWIKEL